MDERLFQQNFDYRTIKPASTPIEAQKSLGKDEKLQTRHNVCVCPGVKGSKSLQKVSHMHAVKRIFKKLFSYSDYAGKNQDRRSTSGGCPISCKKDFCTLWQCKKQTIVAISSTEAEYVAAASCCAQRSTITALAAEEAHSTSPHSRAASSPRDAQGTPTQSAAQDSSLQGTAAFQGTADLQGTAEAQDTADSQGTAEAQGTDAVQGAADIPQSPNDYTPTDASQTSGGDEGLLDLYALNREVRRLKKQTISQAKQIHKLKVKLKKLSKVVEPVVKHHAFWVESQNLKKRRKKQRKKQRKKVSSVKLGRNKDASNLSEENNDHDQDDHTAFVYEDFDATAFVTPDLERKSDETEEVLIEEEKDASDVKSGDTEELDLERIQSTARQSTVTPRTLNFDDEAGPSSPIRPTQEEEPEEKFKDDEFLADLNRTRGLSIPGPMQSQPQQPTQASDLKEKSKGILVEESKKKKLTLQQI
ncbi:hypothetical protein Tco_1248876, partial [Tanacetum coccineum]